jgi:putative endopeptidase
MLTKHLKTKGNFTSGEDIADLGGLIIAFHAMKTWILKNTSLCFDCVDSDGYTVSQRFFMASANAERTKYRDEYLLNLVKTDPHCPNEFRFAIRLSKR